VGATETCVFCEIIAGRAPASVVLEDELAVCFLDIQPVNPGHALVVPKNHASGLADLDLETAKHLFALALRVQHAIRASGLRCDGINVLAADGASAGQEVDHLHLHVIPRFEGDSLVIKYDWTVAPTREELDGVARQIHHALR
jgi:histidine triad (HIT) family protein